MPRFLNPFALATLVLILSSNMAIAEDKTVGILVFDKVLTSDITAPLEVFGVASRKTWFSDYTPVLINMDDKDHVVTEEGLTLLTHHRMSDMPKVDVLIVPSRYDMEPLIENQAVNAFIRQTATTAEWLASNCSGAFLLAEAGVLDGLKATTWAGGEGQLQSAYPQVKVIEDQNVVVDGNVITSNGSLVSYQAALTLLAKMTSKWKADEVAEAIQYSRFSSKEYTF